MSWWSFLSLSVLSVLLSACQTKTTSQLLQQQFSPLRADSVRGDLHLMQIWVNPPQTQLLLAAMLPDSLLITSSVRDSLSQAYPQFDSAKGVQFVMQLEIRPDIEGPGLLPGMRPDVESQVIPGGNYKEQLHYYIDGMRQRMWFECDGYEYPVEGYVYNRSFGLTSYRRIQFGSSQANSECNLVLDENLPGVGRWKKKIKEMKSWD
jgi:hypothetical protein